MTSQECTFGTRIALDVRSDSESDVSELHTPLTLQDLIETVKKEHPEEPLGMLTTTARYIADYIGVPMEQLSLDSIDSSGIGFSRYLTTKKYKNNSIRAYRNYYQRLLKLALASGWEPKPSRAEIEWETLFNGRKLPPGCSGIVHFSIAVGRAPADLTEVDLDAWTKSMIERGRGHDYVTQRIWYFRRLIKNAGISGEFPNLRAHRKPEKWAIPTEAMPDPLRSEVTQLLRWKQDTFAPGRPRHGKLRPVSASVLEGCLDRLYGYATVILGRADISTFSALVCEEVVASYLSWALNEKGVAIKSLSCFGGLLAAVRHYPKYKGTDFKWFVELLAQIPDEPQSAINDRKQKKYLPHQELAKIPELLRGLRHKEEKGSFAYARLTHDELIVRILLTLAWRQRNIREARLGTRAMENFFKDGFPNNLNIAKPQWVLDRLEENPNATFWQIYFRAHETKTAQEVRGVWPKQLISLLEEYVNECRPILAKKNAGNLLFLNRRGGPLGVRELTALIGNLTVRYCGKRVTPHLFRDAFAHRWLDEHPDDYLSLSKILWHRNIKTTIQIYGRNFDESHGMNKAADWLDEHR